MKKVFALALFSLGLAACSSTWHGAKEDTARNVERTGEGWDKTKEAVRKGGNAVGRGLSNVGEKIEDATE